MSLKWQAFVSALGQAIPKYSVSEKSTLYKLYQEGKFKSLENPNTLRKYLTSASKRSPTTSPKSKKTTSPKSKKTTSPKKVSSVVNAIFANDVLLVEYILDYFPKTNTKDIAEIIVKFIKMNINERQTKLTNMISDDMSQITDYAMLIKRCDANPLTKSLCDTDAFWKKWVQYNFSPKRIMKSVLSWRDEAKRLSQIEYKYKYGPKDMHDIGEMYRRGLITKEEADKRIHDSWSDTTFKGESMLDYITDNRDFDGRFYNDVVGVYNLIDDEIRTEMTVNTDIGDDEDYEYLEPDDYLYKDDIVFFSK